jgi:hypothetical protein
MENADFQCLFSALFPDCRTAPAGTIAMPPTSLEIWKLLPTRDRTKFKFQLGDLIDSAPPIA